MVRATLEWVWNIALGMGELNLGIEDLVRQDWLDAGMTSVWVTAYRAALPAAQVPKPTVVELPAARVTFMAAKLTYQELEVNGSLLDEVAIELKERETPEGSYVLISAPFGVGSQEGDEPQTRRIVAAAAGLISAINGGGLTFEFVFENIIDLDTGQRTGFTPPRKTPIAFGPPRVSTAELAVTAEAAKALEALDPVTQQRIALALHWQHESVRAVDPRNEFIAMWTGLEALAMPGTSNVKAANKLLATANGVTVQEANAIFGLGRLLNFRSKILHGESLPPVHGDLINYLRALFTDLLLIVLGLTPQGRARAYMEEPLFGSTFDLQQLTRVA